MSNLKGGESLSPGGINVDRIQAEKTLEATVFMEARLGLRYANLLLPMDLALSGAVAFADDEVSYHIEGSLSQNRLKVYPEAWYRVRGLDRIGFLSTYAELTADGDYANGTVAKALSEAESELSPEDFRDLKGKVAEIYACFLYKDPEQRPRSGLQIDHGFNRIILSERTPLALYRPIHTLIEYGPGIVGTRRIPTEIPRAGEAMMIEGGPTGEFKGVVLKTLAQLYGIKNEQLSVFTEGIQAVTEHLLRVDTEDKVDLIVASGIHMAGWDEIKAGIENGYKLLAKGGYFITRNLNEVDHTTMSGRGIVERATKLFGKPLIQVPYNTLQETTGKKSTGLAAIFRK